MHVRRSTGHHRSNLRQAFMDSNLHLIHVTIYYLMPRRRLRRRAKDLVCMRQLAQCGYCQRALCDAFEVDHVNECCADDRESNLVACCALCHAIKSRHVRLNRDWSSMQEAIAANALLALDRWKTEPPHGLYAALPPWLQARVSSADAYVYSLSLQQVPAALHLEQFRYRPAHRQDRRSGLRDV